MAGKEKSVTTKQRKNFTSVGSTGPCWEPVKDYGKSLVDKSNYKPDIMLVRDRLLAGVAASTGRGIYDFADGKIDLENKYFNQLINMRSKALDVTEVEEIGAWIKAQAEGDIKKAKKQEEAMQKAIEAQEAAEISAQTHEKGATAEVIGADV